MNVLVNVLVIVANAFGGVTVNPKERILDIIKAARCLFTGVLVYFRLLLIFLDSNIFLFKKFRTNLKPL
jgi:hypothetical protein